MNDIKLIIGVGERTISSQLATLNIDIDYRKAKELDKLQECIDTLYIEGILTRSSANVAYKKLEKKVQDEIQNMAK